MTNENVWPAGELTFLQKEEKFSDRRFWNCPSVTIKARTSVQKEETWNHWGSSRGPLSYTKVITAFRIELNAEAEFCHGLVPKVSTANARQEIFSTEALKRLSKSSSPPRWPKSTHWLHCYWSVTKFFFVLSQCSSADTRFGERQPDCAEQPVA